MRCSWLLVLLGCGATPPLTADTGRPPREDTAPQVPSGQPVVVLWTIDTLGQGIADETGWCEALRETLGAHGLDLACVGGAVAPSSWTVESHARLLWPSLARGPRRARLSPGCGEPSALQLLQGAHGGLYVLGMDNPAFDQVMSQADCGDASSWRGAAQIAFWLPLDQPLDEVLLAPEEARPWRMAVEELLASTRGGAPGFAFLNDFEAGGHVPRCWFDPSAPPCEALWSLAVAYGVISGAEDQRTTFLDGGFWRELGLPLRTDPDLDTELLRETVWGAIALQADHFGHGAVLGQLDVLLTGLEAQGRLGDLTLVITSDHGESPCADQLLIGARHCGHGSMPNEFNVQVPVYVSPAAAAADWAAAGLTGDTQTPWELSNLSWGLLQRSGVEIPASWGEPQAPGLARTLTCYYQASPGQAWGLAATPQGSVRCDKARCGAWTWETFSQPHQAPTPQPYPPRALAPLLEPRGRLPNWFAAACAGEVED